MNAHKLKSGSWNCMVYDYTTPEGKRVYKSFTCADPSPAGKRRCEADAATWAAQKNAAIREKTNPKLGDAIDQYIDGIRDIASPRTIASYEGYRRLYFQKLMGVKIHDITKAALQKEVNELAKKLSSKTVYNAFSIIRSTTKQYAPLLCTGIKLPRKKATEQYIPTEGDIQRLIDAIKGTWMELPVYLAAFTGMRRGEICGLHSYDVEGNVIHIRRNKVKSGNKEHPWIMKDPKTEAGYRIVEVPDFVAEMLKGKEGWLVPETPDSITKRFSIILEENCIPHFRFHDLRHWQASISHALGVPDQYIQKRIGHSDVRTLQTIYRHALSDKQKDMDNKINSYLDKTFGKTS